MRLIIITGLMLVASSVFAAGITPGLVEQNKLSRTDAFGAIGRAGANYTITRTSVYTFTKTQMQKMSRQLGTNLTNLQSDRSAAVVEVTADRDRIDTAIE